MKITREVDGGEYVDRITGERINAILWAKDGDHPMVERYPIEKREYKGLLVLGPKDKLALRHGDWICEEQGEKKRTFIVSGKATEVEGLVEESPGLFRKVKTPRPSPFEERYVDAATWDKEQVAKKKADKAAKVVVVVLAVAAALFGDPGSITLIAFGVTHLMYYSPLLSQWNGTANGVFDLDEAADDMRVSAHTNTYAINQDTHNFFDDLTNEVTGTNYTAGGAAIGSQTLARSTNTVTFDGADIVWTQSGAGFSTARKFVVYRFNATPGNAPLFSVVTADADVGNVTGDLTIQWSASGISTWSTT